MTSTRTTQHLAARAARAVGVTLVIIPALGATPAAADTTPPRAPWTALDQTTDEMHPVPRDWQVVDQRPAPTVRRATAPHARRVAPQVHRKTPRVAGQQPPRRPWRPSSTCRARGGVWLVGPGDTLSGISTCTGVSVEQLAAHNGITNPDRIRIGQRLRIPEVTR